MPSRVARRIEEAAAGHTPGATPSPEAADPAASSVATLRPAPVRTAPPVAAPPVTDMPVTVQPYHQNTAATLQAPQAVQTSGRDDAFVF
jgi:type IV secretion system protein VirB1